MKARLPVDPLTKPLRENAVMPLDEFTLHVAEVKVPVNKTPLPTPPLPFPVIVKEPPAPKVPPVANEPPVSAPVVKVTLPRLLPAHVGTQVPPVTLVRTDPVNVRAVPPLIPVTVPPVFA